MNQRKIVLTVIWGIRLSFAAVVLALLTGLLSVTQPVRAATYVVTNSNNSGPGSLRQAIDDANNNPGADTITFAVATDGNPIVLAGAAGENGNASGDLDILDGGNLTIQGNGAANTILDGGGKDRVFEVCPTGGCTNTVIFSGMTIRNGNADHGGGILIVAGTTKVDSSTISANEASDGGGIYNFGAALTLRNDSIIGGVGAGNTANRGGGIFNDNFGTATVDGSTISANEATDDGGGVYNEASTLNIQNGSIIGGAGAGNKANRGGGGIFNLSHGTTIVDGSSVSANEASNGGGIFTGMATLIIQNGSTIGGTGTGNKATAGGGGINTGGPTTIEDSTVSANTARYGGGICNYDGTTTVTGSTVSANSAGFGGGIINQDGTTTVVGSRILNNMADDNGGGVYNDSSIAGATSVTSSCIIGNSTISYFNNQAMQQIATGNWWGAATGPNAPARIQLMATWT